MRVSITKAIGKSTLTFEVEGEKEIDTLAKASAFTTMPDKCDLCQSEDVVLSSNKAESFTFVKIKCLKCNARSQMGQYKDRSGIFFKRWEVYQPPQTSTTENGEEE